MSQDNTVSVTDQAQAGIAPSIPSSQLSDPLAKATAAIEMIISQTNANPSARASQIAATKAAYIAEKFGVR
jgi:hypothetical protein